MLWAKRKMDYLPLLLRNCTWDVSPNIRRNVISLSPFICAFILLHRVLFIRSLFLMQISEPNYLMRLDALPT
jgi:hypothetical protein